MQHRGSCCTEGFLSYYGILATELIPARELNCDDITGNVHKLKKITFAKPPLLVSQTEKMATLLNAGKTTLLMK